VQGLNLLSGEVAATAIKADVSAAGNPPKLGDHSSFVGLSVAGHPAIGDKVPANTKLSLAGIGTLWLHRVLRTSRGITVIMVQLDVTVTGNPFGLKAGTIVNVGYARIGVS
ncbi:MAG: choice-of-anchor P family protein, partial [Streptosporangiaceae bacterium]